MSTTAANGRAPAINWEQDRLDLFQGCVDLKLQPELYLKIGRQRLQRQRIGRDDAPNGS